MDMTIEKLIADKDKAAWKWTATATHQGEIWGIAPTGKKVILTGIIVDRFKDGKIIQHKSLIQKLTEFIINMLVKPSVDN